jgi:hypothetical protein
MRQPRSARVAITAHPAGGGKDPAALSGGNAEG